MAGKKDDEHITNIRGICRIDELRETDFRGLEHVKPLLGCVKEKKMTKEERRKLAEKFAKEDTSDIFREFNIK